jgi:hypothetical protein
MLCDQSFLLDLARRRANSPQDPFTSFCPCSLNSDPAACTRHSRPRPTRRRRSRCTERARSSDPDGDRCDPLPAPDVELERYFAAEIADMAAQFEYQRGGGNA